MKEATAGLLVPLLTRQAMKYSVNSTKAAADIANPLHTMYNDLHQMLNMVKMRLQARCFAASVSMNMVEASVLPAMTSQASVYQSTVCLTCFQMLMLADVAFDDACSLGFASATPR